MSESTDKINAPLRSVYCQNDLDMYIEACKLSTDELYYHYYNGQYNGVADYINSESNDYARESESDYYADPELVVIESLYSLFKSHDDEREYNRNDVIVFDLAKIGLIDIEFIDKELKITSAYELLEVIKKVALLSHWNNHA